MMDSKKDKLICALIDEIVNRSPSIEPSSEEKIHMALYSEDTDTTCHLICYALITDSDEDEDTIYLTIFKNGVKAGYMPMDKSGTSSFYVHCGEYVKVTESTRRYTYYIGDDAGNVRSNTIVTDGYSIHFGK